MQPCRLRLCTPRASFHKNDNSQTREQSDVKNEINSESDKNNSQNSKNFTRVEVYDENQSKHTQTKTMPSLATTDLQKSNLPAGIETNPSRITQLKPNIKV